MPIPKIACVAIDTAKDDRYADPCARLFQWETDLLSQPRRVRSGCVERRTRDLRAEHRQGVGGGRDSDRRRGRWSADRRVRRRGWTIWPCGRRSTQDATLGERRRRSARRSTCSRSLPTSRIPMPTMATARSGTSMVVGAPQATRLTSYGQVAPLAKAGRVRGELPGRRLRGRRILEDSQN